MSNAVHSLFSRFTGGRRRGHDLSPLRRLEHVGFRGACILKKWDLLGAHNPSYKSEDYPGPGCSVRYGQVYVGLCLSVSESHAGSLSTHSRCV